MVWLSVLLLIVSAAIAGINAKDVVVRADDANGGIQYIGSGWQAGKANSLGDCTSGAVYRFSYTVGDGLSFTFTGTAVKINVLGSYDRGIVRFELDGDSTEVDTYSFLRKCETPFQRSNLENKSHTVKASFVKGSPQETAEQLKGAPSVIVLESIVYTVPDVVQPPPTTQDPTTPTTAAPPPAQTTGAGGNTTPAPSANDSPSSPSAAPSTTQSGSSSGPQKSLPPTANSPSAAASTTNSPAPDNANANVNIPPPSSAPNIPLIIGCVVAGLAIVLLFLVFLWWWRRYARGRGAHVRPLSGEEDGIEVQYNRPSAWPRSFHWPRTPHTPHTPHTPNVPRTPVPPLPPVTRQVASSNSLRSLALLQRPEDTPAAAPAVRRLPQTPPDHAPEPESDTSVARMAASRASRSEKNPQYVLVNPGPPTGIPHTPWGPAVHFQGHGPPGLSSVPQHAPSVPSEAPSSPVSSDRRESRSESTSSPLPGDSVSMVSGLTASSSMFRTMSDTEMERLARHVVHMMREEGGINPIPVGALGPDNRATIIDAVPPPQYEDNPFHDSGGVGTAR